MRRQLDALRRERAVLPRHHGACPPSASRRSRVVFGSSTAGGAYQPGMCDYNIFIRGAVAGVPRRPAAREDGDRRGRRRRGARRRARCTRTTSGLADYLADDELDALRMARDVIAHLNWRKLRSRPDDARGRTALRPRGAAGAAARRPAHADGHPRGDRAHRGRLALRGVQTALRPHARLRLGLDPRVSGRASSATTACCSRTRPQKAAQFIQLCNQIDVPIIFLQNITGYMVGKAVRAAAASSRTARR